MSLPRGLRNPERVPRAFARQSAWTENRTSINYIGACLSSRPPERINNSNLVDSVGLDAEGRPTSVYTEIW
jgi:hypothetical protein